jgi:hypothetical protein
MAHTLDAADVDAEAFCASLFAEEAMPALEHVSACRQVIGQASSSAADAGRAEAAKMAALVPPALPNPSASPSMSSAATTIPLFAPDPPSISSLVESWWGTSSRAGGSHLPTGERAPRSRSVAPKFIVVVGPEITSRIGMYSQPDLLPAAA